MNGYNMNGDKKTRTIDTSSPTSEEAMEEDLLGPDMLNDVREFYREDSECDWEEGHGDVTENDSLRSAPCQCAQAAIVVFRQKQGQKKGASLHSIMIQSPALKNILEVVFYDYDGLTTQLTSIVHTPPLHEYYYRWHLFEAACKEVTDPIGKRHLELLYPIVSKEILPHIEAMEDFTKNNVITFDYLWAIFPPDMTVFSNVDDHDRIFEVKKTEYVIDSHGKPYLRIKCRYVETDGERFGYATKELYIQGFSGVMKITELSVIPCHLHPNCDGVLGRLHDRGARFEKYLGCHHVNYSGFYKIDTGRFIIDRRNFDMNSDGCVTKGLGDLNRQEAPHAGSAMFHVLNVVHRATLKASNEFRSIMRGYKVRDLERISTLKLTSRQRMLCTPILKGFCLTYKKWCEFSVSGVSDIEWNEDAFSRLVIAQGYKEVIHAFVQEQLNREDDDFDDIISGKGQGFIMLLSGEPGVGKTLTAESVCERMHRPLYSIGAGELGETASEIEESLETLLEVVAKWKAILLLDECDVFLEARTTADIARNRLVSIFLRQLEYFRGVMFLTTNRVTTFDAAFESRIHLTIDYPALNAESRLCVWQTFLRSQVGCWGPQGPGGSSVSEDDLKVLAERKLNGRQIKNIVKTAWLLAKQNKQPLTLENLQTVLTIKSGAAIFGQ
ncbi:hypothetical protein QBC34DRAFT_379366 [Podospora aff. communis PSN243]|uniref:AAA+ ATPase domain-containing protein n=1 Tax=Podospora aff. communis PSN243 TaxID=3040156 RepID=A0AAV9GQ22_9PEZI|nr:hypothetical protein QBC34DRAFT_379366 [Podospora aff. communis PSN243]